MDSSKQQVEQLRQQQRDAYKRAGDDGTLRLLRLVALELGASVPANYGPKWQYSCGEIHLYRDEHGGYTTVVADGRQVCNTHPNVELFVPGEWVEQLKDFVVLDLRTRGEDAGVRYKANRDDLVQRLGLKGIDQVPLPDEDVIEEEPEA